MVWGAWLLCSLMVASVGPPMLPEAEARTQAVATRREVQRFRPVDLQDPFSATRSQHRDRPSRAIPVADLIDPFDPAVVQGKRHAQRRSTGLDLRNPFARPSKSDGSRVRGHARSRVQADLVDPFDPSVTNPTCPARETRDGVVVQRPADVIRRTCRARAPRGKRGEAGPDLRNPFI